MSFKDYFSQHAHDYKKFRPDYPTEIIDFVVTQCQQKNTAWDCATGNGQVAQLLQPYFKKIYATDASAEQIQQTSSTANIQYAVARAEASGLPNHSIDLITVAQAAHWFDLPLFYQEVQRVAALGAVLAIWGYHNHSIHPEIDAIVLKLYKDILKDYWPPERGKVEEKYASMNPPFQKINCPDFFMKKQVDLNGLIGYLATWSATQIYISKNKNNPIEYIYDELHESWGNACDIKEITWPVFLNVFHISN